MAASQNGWRISKNFLNWEMFVQKNSHKGERFVKMLCGKWKDAIT